MASVLLTGATGFVGGVILARLLEETDHDVIALVRAADDAAAAERLAQTAGRLWEQPDLERVRAVAADLEQPAVGLAPRLFDELAERAQVVIHSAAAITFDQPLADAHRINVGGTAGMLELASASEARMVHISTAYIAGTRTGLVMEDEGDLGQSFRNTYERTKLEAEGLVSGYDGSVAIIRPSIIVGESSGGWTSAFNVVYGPMRAFASGRLRSVPASGDGLVDLVPVDLVAEAALSLAESRDPGTFHLASGAGATTGEVLSTMVARAVGVEPIEFRPEAGSGIGDYGQYLDVACTFDTSRTRDTLGIEVPPPADYLPDLLDYAERAAWGKRSISRERARAAATIPS